MASSVDKAWLQPTDIVSTHEIDPDSGHVRAYERQMYGSIVLSERNTTTDPLQAAPLLADAFLAAPRSDAEEQLIRRLQFADIPFDLREPALRAAAAARRISDIDLHAALDWSIRQRLEQEAPASIFAPSGRAHRPSTKMAAE